MLIMKLHAQLVTQLKQFYTFSFTKIFALNKRILLKQVSSLLNTIKLERKTSNKFFSLGLEVPILPRYLEIIIFKQKEFVGRYYSQNFQISTLSHQLIITVPQLQVSSLSAFNMRQPLHEQTQDTDSFQDQKIIISGDNIHKTYLFGLEGVAALRGVSLNIRVGQFVMILGNSGGGKTSLLNIIGTIDKLTKGNLQLYHQKIKESTTDQILSGLRLNYIGFVFQTFNLISSLTAKQNVQLPMILKGDLSGQEISMRAQKLLESVGMSHRLKHFPNQLSGGEQQRVTIARALANKPQVLLLDEPTGDLDTRNTHIVLDIMLKLNEMQKITLVMVTHDVNLKYLAHRILKVLDGKIIGEEIIQSKVRQQHISNLRKKLQDLNKKDQVKEQVADLKVQKRKVQEYGAIKWLKEKQIRDKIQKEMIQRCRNQLSKLNLGKISEETAQKIQHMEDLM